MFAQYVGIDWSGDKEAWQRGLVIAVAHPGRARPKLVPGPGPKGRWSRAAAAAFIVEEAARRPTLFGIDFAFGFPVNEDGTCWGWDHAEEWSGAAENFYGGAFFRNSGGPHAAFVNANGHRGVHYKAARLRLTDRQAALTRGCTPQSVFNAVGAAQVGPASISGMRMLRALQLSGAPVAIWPLAMPMAGQSAIVEIFPRYMALAADVSPRLKDMENLCAALRAYGSEPVEAAPQNEDEGDAVLAAAALRLLAEPKHFAVPAGIDRREGWIFGVPFP